MTPSNQIKLRRLPFLPSLELLWADYGKQHFARHFHENYGIGVIARGAPGFYYRGENIVAPTGTISLF